MHFMCHVAAQLHSSISFVPLFSLCTVSLTIFYIYRSANPSNIPYPLCSTSKLSFLAPPARSIMMRRWVMPEILPFQHNSTQHPLLSIQFSRATRYSASLQHSIPEHREDSQSAIILQSGCGASFHFQAYCQCRPHTR